MSSGKLHIVPLGGLGEFGMNCMAIRWGEDIVVIDAGMMFPEAELLGVDIVVPDISYLIENRQRIRAIVLTHGHDPDGRQQDFAQSVARGPLPGCLPLDGVNGGAVSEKIWNHPRECG